MLRFFDGEDEVACHVRCWGRKQTLEKSEHRAELADISARLGELVDLGGDLNAMARAALAYGDADLRPVLRRYIRGHAEIHGRSSAEQVRAFLDEGNALFGDLSILAWGIAL